MVNRKNNELEEVRLFVTNLMNREQQDHARLINELKSKLGLTQEFINTAAVLGQIWEAKDKILHEIYDKIKVL